MKKTIIRADHQVHGRQDQVHRVRLLHWGIIQGRVPISGSITTAMDTFRTMAIIYQKANGIRMALITAVDEVLRWLRTQTVVIRSTVPVGYCQLASEYYHQNIVFQPEYYGETLAHPFADLTKRKWIVLGGKEEDRDRVVEAYQQVYNADVHFYFTDTKTAELAKYMANTYFATKVTFCNEFYDIAKMQGVNYNELREIWHEHDVQFVHGKVYRRQYLIEQNVCHDEKLTGCQQDGYFNRLAKTMTSKFRYCEQPFYLWKWRDNSVARGDRKHMLKTFTQMLDANDALVEEYIRRDKHRQAIEAVIGGVLDTYYTLQRSEWHLKENAEYLEQAEKRFSEYYAKNKTMWENAPAEIKVRMSHGIRQRSIRKGMLFENETLEQWLKKV